MSFVRNVRLWRIHWHTCYWLQYKDNVFELWRTLFFKCIMGLFTVLATETTLFSYDVCNHVLAFETTKFQLLWTGHFLLAYTFFNDV